MKRYFVEYNAKFIATYKSIRACIRFIERNGLKGNYSNSLCIYDNDGNEYEPINGNLITEQL